MSDETPAQRTPEDEPQAPLVRPKDYGSLLDRVRPRGPRRPGSGYVSPMECDWPDGGEWGDGR